MSYPLACIILASGFAERFGSNKLLHTFRGRPLISYILQSTQGLFEQRVVITRYQELAELCRKDGVPCFLHNKKYLNDTISIGLEHIRHEQVRGYIFCTGDQPLLQRSSLERLADAFCDSPRYITRLAHGELPGNPVIFPAELLTELRSLPQDKGGSFLAKKYPERVRLVQVRDERELFDIDTARDYERLLSHAAEEYSKG